jgi:uncharacterized protein (DUF1778 family)
METDEQERWRLEAALDKANTQIGEDALILDALGTYLFAEHLDHPIAPKALEQLRAIYAAVMRNRYPDGRP